MVKPDPGTPRRKQRAGGPAAAASSQEDPLRLDTVDFKQELFLNLNPGVVALQG
jgi:hypothetical protein